MNQYQGVEESVEKEEQPQEVVEVKKSSTDVNVEEKKDADMGYPDDQKMSKEVENNEQETEEKAESTDAKRTLSIVGDSISTFRGVIPEGYYDFFPDNGLVKDVAETWWKPVIDNCNLQLYVNASSSGATCAGDSTSTDNPQVGCDELRTKALCGTNGEEPDIIIVYMGTNDLLESIPIGNNDGTKAVAEGMVECFSDAYTLMIDKLKLNYPQAEIYCCTITPLGTWGENEKMITFVNGVDGGLTAKEYSERIQQIANNKGCKIIDLYHCGIDSDNISEMTSDGVHPNVEGMRCIERAVEKALAQ